LISGFDESVNFPSPPPSPQRGEGVSIFPRPSGERVRVRGIFNIEDQKLENISLIIRALLTSHKNPG